MLAIKRAYEPPSASDGKRVLVERLWPRGLTKARAAIDLWLKEVSPSPELRKWYAHDPEKWPEFQLRYRAELKTKTDLLDQLQKMTLEGPLTLIYAAHDPQRNSATVLKEILESRNNTTLPGR